MSSETLRMLELELDESVLILSLLRDFAEPIEIGCVTFMML